MLSACDFMCLSMLQKNAESIVCGVGLRVVAGRAECSPRGAHHRRQFSEQAPRQLSEQDPRGLVFEAPRATRPARSREGERPASAMGQLPNPKSNAEWLPG